MKRGSLLLGEGKTTFFLRRDVAEAEVAWCHATLDLNLGPDELPRLADGLRRLHESGSGSFLWTNDGGEVRIEVVMAKRGEVHWSVRLQSPPDYLHELRLVFVGRQDDLPSLLENL